MDDHLDPKGLDDNPVLVKNRAATSHQQPFGSDRRCHLTALTGKPRSFKSLCALCALCGETQLFSAPICAPRDDVRVADPWPTITTARRLEKLEMKNPDAVFPETDVPLEKT